MCPCCGSSEWVPGQVCRGCWYQGHGFGHTHPDGDDPHCPSGRCDALENPGVRSVEITLPPPPALADPDPSTIIVGATVRGPDGNEWRAVQNVAGIGYANSAMVQTVPTATIANAPLTGNLNGGGGSALAVLADIPRQQGPVAPTLVDTQDGPRRIPPRAVISCKQIQYVFKEDREGRPDALRQRLDFLLDNMLARLDRLEGKVTQALREGLHEVDQGNVPQARRILRNALEELQQSPEAD